MWITPGGAWGDRQSSGQQPRRGWMWECYASGLFTFGLFEAASSFFAFPQASPGVSHIWPLRGKLTEVLQQLFFSKKLPVAWGHVLRDKKMFGWNKFLFVVSSMKTTSNVFYFVTAIKKIHDVSSIKFIVIAFLNFTLHSSCHAMWCDHCFDS